MSNFLFLLIFNLFVIFYFIACQQLNQFIVKKQNFPQQSVKYFSIYIYLLFTLNQKLIHQSSLSKSSNGSFLLRIIRQNYSKLSIPSPSRSASSSIYLNSSSESFSPTSPAIFFKFLKEILLIPSSSNNLKIFIISSLESLGPYIYLFIYHSLRHYICKFIKINSIFYIFSKVHVYLTDILLFHFHSKSFHNSFQFSCVNLTYIKQNDTSIFTIKKFESLFKLSDCILISLFFILDGFIFGNFVHVSSQYLNLKIIFQNRKLNTKLVGIKFTLIIIYVIINRWKKKLLKKLLKKLRKKLLKKLRKKLLKKIQYQINLCIIKYHINIFPQIYIQLQKLELKYNISRMISLKKKIAQQSIRSNPEHNKYSSLKNPNANDSIKQISFKLDTVVDQSQFKQSFYHEINKNIPETKPRVSLIKTNEDMLFNEKYLSGQLTKFKQILFYIYLESLLLVSPLLIMLLITVGLRLFIEATLFVCLITYYKIVISEMQIKGFYIICVFFLQMVVIADFISEFDQLNVYNSIYFSTIVNLYLLILNFQKLTINKIQLQQESQNKLNIFISFISKLLKIVTNTNFWLFNIICISIQLVASILFSSLRHNLISNNFVLALLMAQILLIVLVSYIDEVCTNLDNNNISKIINGTPLCLWMLRIKVTNTNFRSMQFTSLKHIYNRVKQQRNFLEKKVSKSVFDQNTYWDIFIHYINNELQYKELQIIELKKNIKIKQQQINSYNKKTLYQDALKEISHIIDYSIIKYNSFLIIANLKSTMPISDIVGMHIKYQKTQNVKSACENYPLKIKIMQNMEYAQILIELGLDNVQKDLKQFIKHSLNILELFELNEQQRKFLKKY